MNITRVERDGVEFFTIDETGESGMSESGVARLCGVAPVSGHQFISNSLIAWEQEKELNPAFRKTIAFNAKHAKDFKPGQNSNIKILSATVCARTIEQVCTPHDIRVTFEKVDRPKLNRASSN